MQIVASNSPAFSIGTSGSDDWPTYFTSEMSLRPGIYTALVQTQLPKAVPACTVHFRVRADRDDDILAECETHLVKRHSDRLLVTFTVKKPTICRFTGKVEPAAAGAILRYLTVVDGERLDPHDPAFSFARSLAPDICVPTTVILGTTSRCPASCPSCPTNKSSTSSIPKGLMSMALFRKIVDELADLSFDGYVAFALYGEPLVDPLLHERMVYLKEKIPAAKIIFSTTAATYDRARHLPLTAIADGIAVHMEAIDADIYDQAMAPLKAARVFPRIAELMEDAGPKANVVVPVGASNIGQVTKVVEFSRDMGVSHPHFSSLSNRCGVSATFDRESLAPVSGTCTPAKIQSELVVDWDGTIVACCFDFLRQGNIGNLSVSSLREILSGERYRAMLEAFNEKRWDQLPACRECRLDYQPTIDAMVRDRLPDPSEIVVRPKWMRSRDIGGRRGTNGLISGHADAVNRWHAAWQWLMRTGPLLADRFWGPDWPIAGGTYEVKASLTDIRWGFLSRICLEILLDDRIICAETFTRSTEDRIGRIRTIDLPDRSHLRIRISSVGADFRLEEIRLRQLDPPAGA